jgi:UDP-N-acetylmuramoylalanine--D-glutamate ligase
MHMQNLRGKRALVMGLGVNGGGLGMTRFLVEQGAEVTVTDLREAQVLAPSLRALEGLPVKYVLGRHDDADFRTADLVIRNPGVPRESRYLAIAREHGAQIEMEMTLFFRLCQGPIVGITGTRGKTTTTLLTGTLMREQFPDTIIAGNMRISAVEQLSKIGPQTPVVLELSSWQLEGLGDAGLSPHYACVTNLSPDHLDRYRGMEEYGMAKQQIFLHQQSERGDAVVLNADDPIVREWAAKTVVPPAWFSTGEPAHALGAGANVAWWQNNRLMWNDLEICTAKDLRIAGEHNRANAAAAVALARSYQPPVTREHIAAGIRGFEGVPDRQELVRELHGVRYVNDTTATTPTATGAALRALSTPIILIAGGADKHLDFDALASLVAERSRQGTAGGIKAIVLLDGTATPRLTAALAAAGVQPAGIYGALEPAIRAAQALAGPGDTVLLSPACASFGMFVNEFDRGAQFRRIVEALG